MINKPRFTMFLFCVISIILIIFLIRNLNLERNRITEYQERHKQFEEKVTEMDKQITEYKQGIKEQQDKLNEMITYNEELKQFNEHLNQSKIFKITSYDLSYDSCNKTLTSRGYGLTRTGFDLRGKDWRTARTIAVDPKVIELGKRVYIKFLDEKYKNYEGIWVSNDTGNAIKGNRIDLFQGDFQSYYPHKSTVDFGVTEAKIVVLD